MRALPTVIFVGSFFYSSAAIAYCSEPSAPSFYETKPSAPAVPYCVDEFSNTHTCDDWEIESYNTSVDSYNPRLRRYQTAVQSYIEELNQYLRDARNYAECEVSALE
jgi:hypothetical protein